MALKIYRFRGHFKIKDFESFMKENFKSTSNYNIQKLQNYL